MLSGLKRIIWAVSLTFLHLLGHISATEVLAIVACSTVENSSHLSHLTMLSVSCMASELLFWEHNCSTKLKLRTYVTFKDKVEVASHVNCNMPKYDRSLISQLRLGILPLRIETGRFSNLDEEERTCLVCNSGEVENEKHFLFDCDFYLSERNRLENDIECNFANLDLKAKFKTIFEHPFRLAKYVKSAFIKRRQKIYNSV